jgi:DHA1 family inner membrane transport protein
MTAATAAMAVLVAWRVPARLQTPGLRFGGLFALLRLWRVNSVLLVTGLYFTAIFTVFSYIAPVLSALAPGSEAHLSWTLMAFGLSGVAGTLIGGWGTDHLGPRRTLQVMLLTLAGTMIVLPLTRDSFAATLSALMVWGCAGFGMMAPQQTRLARMAPGQAPLLMSLNTSMLYIGMALGAAVGGPAATAWGFGRLPWVAAPFALLAWGLLMAERDAGSSPLAAAKSAPS